MDQPNKDEPVPEDTTCWHCGRGPKEGEKYGSGPEDWDAPSKMCPGCWGSITKAAGSMPDGVNVIATLPKELRDHTVPIGDGVFATKADNFEEFMAKIGAIKEYQDESIPDNVSLADILDEKRRRQIYHAFMKMLDAEVFDVWTVADAKDQSRTDVIDRTHYCKNNDVGSHMQIMVAYIKALNKDIERHILGLTSEQNRISVDKVLEAIRDGELGDVIQKLANGGSEVAKELLEQSDEGMEAVFDEYKKQIEFQKELEKKSVEMEKDAQIQYQ